MKMTKRELVPLVLEVLARTMVKEGQTFPLKALMVGLEMNSTGREYRLLKKAIKEAGWGLMEWDRGALMVKRSHPEGSWTGFAPFINEEGIDWIRNRFEILNTELKLSRNPKTTEEAITAISKEINHELEKVPEELEKAREKYKELMKKGKAIFYM